MFFWPVVLVNSHHQNIVIFARDSVNRRRQTVKCGLVS